MTITNNRQQISVATSMIRCRLWPELSKISHQYIISRLPAGKGLISAMWITRCSNIWLYICLTILGCTISRCFFNCKYEKALYIPLTADHNLFYIIVLAYRVEEYLWLCNCVVYKPHRFLSALKGHTYKCVTFRQVNYQ